MNRIRLKFIVWKRKLGRFLLGDKCENCNDRGCWACKEYDDWEREGIMSFIMSFPWRNLKDFGWPEDDTDKWKVKIVPRDYFLEK